MEQHPKFVDFNGYRFRLSGRYYRKNRWSQQGPSNLHRAIWEHSNGSIPEGMDVHHKNGNSFDNSIGNLELIGASDHARMHTLERIRAGKLLPPSKIAFERAAEWHGSTEGIEWHRMHGSKTWTGKKWSPVACQNCGQQFNTPFPTRAKWCTIACKHEARDRKAGRSGMGLRPNRRKPRLLSGKRAASEQ